MHSTTCGVSAASAANSTTASMHSVNGLKMVHNNDDVMNKIPLKSATGLDDEEKNGGEFIQDTAAAEEARREQMRVNILTWMKKLTIVLICFIGLALISYVIISLCFSEWPKLRNSTTSSTTTTSTTTTSTTTSKSSLLSDDKQSNNNSNSNSINSTSPLEANNTNKNNNISVAGFTDDGKHLSETSATVAGSSSSDAASATTVAYNTVPKSNSSPPPPPPPTPAVAATTIKLTERPPIEKRINPVRDVPIKDEKFVSKLGVYQNAAVCSDREVCSQIGSNILEHGDGSVVDAVIATLLCNGIVTMQSMGIGGGMLMNVYIRESKHAYSIDAREVAPFAAFPEMFDHNEELSLHGGLSIAVPGELMGYHRAHERFGKLPWKALVEPSIKLCEDGFYLTKHQWSALENKYKHLKNNTVITNVFINATTGQLHPINTKLKPSKELCETYKLLAENGPLDFYNGTLSKLVVEDLKDLGSTITSYDLESYFADLVSSITTQLGDDILYSVPPVSSGAVVAHILSILEGYNFTRADLLGAENEAHTIHRMAEAMKFAFAKRWELGDLRFNDVRELVSKLTNPEYGQEVRSQINDTTVLNEIYDYGAQFGGEDDGGTSHIVVLAPNGDAVSVTSSVNDYFGSGQAGSRTGIVFNSGMGDFSIAGKSNYFGLPPAASNYVDARKRPMSSMSPMILAQQTGDVRLLIGAAGGSKIITAIVEVMARVLWFGQNIKEAIDAPRFHHQLLPNVLEYEEFRFTEKLLNLLQAKGHQVKPYDSIGSVVCGIVRNETAIYANADFRKRGGTAGF